MEEDEEELSGARKQKLQERIAALQQAQQLELRKRAIMQKLLEPSAYERLMNVKIANPELYDKVVGTLAYLAERRQLAGKVNEETLVKMLSQMTETRETSIEFKRK